MAQPDMVLRLKVVELREQGLSFGQIGAALGISRSAVAGHLQREKKNPTKPPAPPPVFVRGVLQIVKKAPQPVAPIPVGPDGVAFVDAGLFHCRWVIGRDEGADRLVRFCGQPVVAVEKSWCHKHMRLAFAPKYTRDVDRRIKHDMKKGKLA